MEYQRQQLLQERQQFHMDQIRAAEYRARQIAAQQHMNEQRQQNQGATAAGDQGNNFIFTHFMSACLSEYHHLMSVMLVWVGQFELEPEDYIKLHYDLYAWMALPKANYFALSSGYFFS